MNELKIFENPEFGKVRTALINGEPWFVAKDIADVLEFSEASAMTRSLDEDEKGLHSIQTLGGSQELVTINESGLYSAILRSRKPQAKKFKKWVTSVVLPSIRKHGAYIKEELLDDPDLLEDVVKKLKEEKHKRLEAEKQLEKAQPKIEMFDQLMDTKGLMNFIQVADSFGVCGRNTLMKTLREENILMDGEINKNIPYSQYLKNGYFELVVRPRKTDNGLQEITTTLCTPKALKLIKKVLDKNKDLF